MQRNTSDIVQSDQPNGWGAVTEHEMRAAVQSQKPSDRAEISVVLPVMNETFSLRETVRVLLANNRNDLREIAIVVAARTTSDSREVVAQLAEAEPGLIWIHTQSLPYIGGALQEAFERVCGRYTVLMASDLETDPHLVSNLIAEIRSSQADIVTASRWQPAGRFTGYNPLKLGFNWLFQRLMSTVFSTRLSDVTYAYRIFRTEVLREVSWEELKHPFLLETMVKPLRLGRDVREIPVTWTRRVEGESQMTLPTYWGYFRIAFKTRLRRASAARK
jgi:glycosyltransferase involved in cell wall biosynthesis